MYLEAVTNTSGFKFKIHETNLIYLKISFLSISIFSFIAQHKQLRDLALFQM
jgi:hypothetical protein